MPKIILLLGLVCIIAVLIVVKTGYHPPINISTHSVTGFKGLTFSSADDEKRMRTLDGCIRNPASWQNFDDYQEFGNFYQATWCNGKCKNSSAAPDSRAVHQIKLFTTEYKLPQVSGVGLEVNFVPAQAGWGVNFSLVNNILEEITNNRFQIIFSKYEGISDQEIAKVIMGEGNEYQIYDTTISVPSPVTLKDGLINYTASAQNLRDLSLKLLTDLHQAVIAKINSNTISHCLAVKRRDPLPPECTKEGVLNAQEKADELKKADEYFKSQQDLVQTDYQTMYDVLMKALPPNSCLSEGL